MSNASERLKPRAIPMRPAAEYIGHGLTKTYELANAGLIQTVKSGRKRLAVVASLDGYIDSLLKEQG